MLSIWILVKFLIVFHNILLEKLTIHILVGCILQWVKNGLDGQLQRAMMYGATSSWLPVMSGFPQDSALRPVFSNTFIYDLDEGIKSIFSKFRLDAMLSGNVDLLEGSKTAKEFGWAALMGQSQLNEA